MTSIRHRIHTSLHEVASHLHRRPSRPLRRAARPTSIMGSELYSASRYVGPGLR